MAIGKKTGGKIKGSKNKSTIDFKNTLSEAVKSTKEQLNEHCPGFIPVVFLAKVAMDENNSIEVRVTAAKEVAKYVSPQLKAVETKDTTDLERVYRVVYEDGGNNPAQKTAPESGEDTQGG